jgi:hypothetical protein
MTTLVRVAAVVVFGGGLIAAFKAGQSHGYSLASERVSNLYDASQSRACILVIPNERLMYHPCGGQFKEPEISVVVQVPSADQQNDLAERYAWQKMRRLLTQAR